MASMLVVLRCYPFQYLGLPLGSNMKSIAVGSRFVDSFSYELSSWKVNLLSIAGSSGLLFKSVIGCLGIYYLSILEPPNRSFKTWKEFRLNSLSGVLTFKFAGLVYCTPGFFSFGGLQSGLRMVLLSSFSRDLFGVSSKSISE
ncbi:hypothetical protein Tco_1546750 [Tanacetum coccineum]